MSGTWHELTWPMKRFTGVSGTVTLPAGSIIIYMQFTGGTCQGFPDGQGAGLTITAAAGSGFSYAPIHLGSKTLPNGGTGAATVLTFAGTSMYFVEAINPTGF